MITVEFNPLTQTWVAACRTVDLVIQAASKEAATDLLHANFAGFYQHLKVKGLLEAFCKEREIEESDMLKALGVLKKEIPARLAQARLAFRDHLLVVLREAAKGRHEREGRVRGSDGVLEPAWVQYELEALLTEVNKERTQRGQAPSTIERIRRFDRLACGHQDYSFKLTLYCAEEAIS